MVVCVCAGVLDVPMISWVVMLVSRLLDYVASVEDEAAGSKKHLNGKDRERSYTGTWTDRNTDTGPHSPQQNHSGRLRCVVSCSKGGGFFSKLHF